VCFGVLHHDNESAHTALSLRKYLASKQITLLENLPLSPDLSPIIFFSVPEGKGNIERKAF
jgi:hypothetical protein